MRRFFGIGLFICYFAILGIAQDEPPLFEVLIGLGLDLTPEDEVIVLGGTQGTFMQTGSKVEVLPVAKHSFGIQDVTSEVKAGYYIIRNHRREFHNLFRVGPAAGDLTILSGLPKHPPAPVEFNSGRKPIGFYVQSAAFNPNFNFRGETIFTQDNLNSRIERFGGDHHKVRVFPSRLRWASPPCLCTLLGILHQ